MDCYACDNQATRQCRRCARVYCELHGGELCAECLSPASSLPSFNLYRGSLLALLVGTAVALWLLVRPPGSADVPGVIVADGVTPTSVATQVERTATPARGGTATLTPRPASGTPRPTSTPEEAEPREYIVQDGDTLLGIAEQFAPPGVDVVTYASQIAAASGLASVEEPITPGQTLVLP